MSLIKHVNVSWRQKMTYWSVLSGYYRELIQNKASEVRTVINTADVTAKEHETSFY